MSLKMGWYVPASVDTVVEREIAGGDVQWGWSWDLSVGFVLVWIAQYFKYFI